VRALAQRSTAAARDIKKLIADSNAQIASGTDLAGVAGATMTDIVAGVRELSAILAAINAAGAEQAHGIEQVGHAIAEMDGVTRQNAALVEQAAAAAESMREQAGSLSALVGTFQVSAGAPVTEFAPGRAGSDRPHELFSRQALAFFPSEVI